MLIREFITQEDMDELEEKASRALCTSTKSNNELGASNLASCKSQGYRAREGNKSHLVGHGKSKSRITVGGKKIKGKKYGGPLPDHGTRK
jgi:Uri superfamily endonuclease